MFHAHILNARNPNHVSLGAGYRDAISLSNQASLAMEAGQIDKSIKIHRRALSLKLRLFSETSLEASITYNGLGTALIRAGRFDEAEEFLQKAFNVREPDGPREDAADTRDTIAALREAQGRFEEAREMRLKGSEKNEIMCGNYKCGINRLYALTELKACSACKSVFYCCKKCQAEDWKARHKPLCKAHTSGESTSEPIDETLGEASIYHEDDCYVKGRCRF
ncbi:hypothetical protein F5Y04DRAFT_293441 [Hypomontagnella monticulosa]|nr:hypothetical protein F5Y04DRAFT_293441 [Hypomontagnella monticulosa]